MNENFRSHWPNFSAQGYSTYNDGSSPGFNMPQQSFYGSHRASAPGILARNGQAQDDNIDLSEFDDIARNSASTMPISEIVKPEQAQPWVSATQTAYQNRQLPHPQFLSTYAQTEPPPKQDRISETADSGYQSQTHYQTAPAPALDNLNWNRQELERDYQTQHFMVTPSREAEIDIKSTLSDGRMNSRRDVRRKPQLEPCKWQGCGRTPKNLSDAKKHQLTHTRPFRCTGVDCSRKDGFATDNDLQRHRKSVHGLQPTVGNPAGYICMACTFPQGTQPKFWPRRDNFKAHIKRKHPKHDEERLIESSKQNIRPDDARTADEDARTVRSAIQSAAHHSQVDPTDHHAFQQLQSSPGLSRHASDQGNYPNNLWPPSNSPMFNSTDDMLAGMQGHTADLQQYSPNNAMGAPIANGLNMLSGTSNDFDLRDDSSFQQQQPPFKRLKTSHNTSQQVGFLLPSQHEHTLTLPESQTTSSSSNTQSSSAMSPTGEFPCPECRKVKRRECDLKKHMKRHTRPYGCTFPNCLKKFGSRNDWKRHENTQHFQQEMWKCQCKRLDGTDCVRRPFHQVELLKRHLRNPDHGIKNEAEIDHLCKEYRLGRDGHDHFWCGFCNKLISQPDKDFPNAHDERIKHIGDHFDKDGFDSGDWVCIDEGKKKRFITQEDRREAKRRAKNGFRDDDEEGPLPEYLPATAFGTDLSGMFPSSSSISLKRTIDEVDDGCDDFDD